MLFRTAAPMTVKGPREGEPSSRSMRNGLRIQPAHLVRGSSRRIMTMRFRPANIRVINRRVCSLAVIGTAVRTETLPGPPAGTCSRLRRPSTFVVDARTVLAVKGSLRRAQRALACCAPFRLEGHAMGGSGGNTPPVLQQQKSKPASSLRRKQAWLIRTIKPSAPRKGIDRSLHIRTSA